MTTGRINQVCSLHGLAFQSHAFWPSFLWPDRRRRSSRPKNRTTRLLGWPPLLVGPLSRLSHMPHLIMLQPKVDNRQSHAFLLGFHENLTAREGTTGNTCATGLHTLCSYVVASHEQLFQGFIAS